MATLPSSKSATTAEQRSLPTILLVQGSFQIPQVYEKLVKGLMDQGYPTIHPRLPSCSDVDKPDFPQVSLVDDVLAIRLELIRQIEYEEKNVVVVMHSYGGLVGSEAVTEELSYAKRQSQGLAGGVTHLFYYCAFLLDKGQSVLSAFGESPNSDVRVSMLDTLLRKPVLRDL
jgi:pimeloyl-ACP methyl ester carboxylesterase